MGIIIYFLVGIASIVASIISFSLGVEWWAGLIILICGIGSIIIALYKLDEETSFFTDYLKNRKKQKADKIYNNEFKTEKLDMVKMLIKAHDERKEYGKAHIEKKAFNGIMRFYKELQKNWTLVARENEEYKKECDEAEVKRRLFGAFEALIIIAVDCDEKRDDYDFYKRFCQEAGKELGRVAPKKKSELTEIATKIIGNGKDGYGIRLFSFLKYGGRRSVKSRIYTEFVQAICYLMLFDEIVHENEYYICSILFDDIDKYPKTWEQFKLEY